MEGREIGREQKGRGKEWGVKEEREGREKERKNMTYLTTLVTWKWPGAATEYIACQHSHGANNKMTRFWWHTTQCDESRCASESAWRDYWLVKKPSVPRCTQRWFNCVNSWCGAVGMRNIVPYSTERLFDYKFSTVMRVGRPVDVKLTLLPSRWCRVLLLIVFSVSLLELHVRGCSLCAFCDCL